jgi:hypothetical protein
MTPLIAKKALMPDDLTDDDKAILAELLRETIERDRFPLSPRVKAERSPAAAPLRPARRLAAVAPAE